ncbi:hypothetical protein Cyast_1007 [Cyanobacterium stanieri PCC 7202]|uniref:Uncharacterized protein n=1 Tax=Cyanobacterium stanieri (strain ATCC 29140 / PCC 7202) TaxID=292563 RepID=K9YLJ1_CYASC|nr:hypothetical protein Cyast_1007 [Cyanobacterium stanieri PCC 7202]
MIVQLIFLSLIVNKIELNISLISRELDLNHILLPETKLYYTSLRDNF